MHIHDLIGIGFGPSNIALAIALEEGRDARPQHRPLDALFVERQPGFVWHRNMLLDQAHMQISFLKDLATLRNPSSRFTFLNYLHEKDRLQDFINLKTFSPAATSSTTTWPGPRPSSRTAAPMARTWSRCYPSRAPAR